MTAAVAEDNGAYVRELLWKRDPGRFIEIQFLVQAALYEETELQWPQALAV